MAEKPADEKMLKVFEQLEIGPIHVDTNRLTAPYRIVRQGKHSEFNFEIVYEDEVFDIKDASHKNLASMIAAQPLLNYGLFTKSMSFLGDYDNHDRRTIRRWGETIAREVFFNRILQPNPFLEGPVTQLQPTQRKGLLRSDLSFPPLDPSAPTIVPEPWAMSRDRHAVLMDGSRGSLLSLAMLQEMGCETYPIFIHGLEQPRPQASHTLAYMKEHNTPRLFHIHSNQDQLNDWFLEHIPFLKKDWASLRGPTPPLKVWEVSPQLFMMLPLLRKLRVGRIIVPHNYSTTQKKFFHSLVHHFGDYDKSHYCDIAQSRFFQQKGWSISQFSLLRPLSEFLIEKLLRERYPAYHKLQMTCIRPEQEDGEIRPCGWCSPCQLHIGWLLALDTPPETCGYQPEQIETALRALVSRRPRQPQDELDHLLYLLKRKGALEPSWNQVENVKPQPHILLPRFNREQSPINSFPNDLREPLYHIFLQHTEHMLLRVGRGWKQFDPSEHKHSANPYPFEAEVETETDLGKRVIAEEASHQMTNEWGELTWPEAQQKLEYTEIAILPVGAMVQHGPHLPLDTSAFLAQRLAQQAAQACGSPHPLVLPVLPFGVSFHHDTYRGTLSIQGETLAQLVYEIGKGLGHNGISKLLIINGHEGNVPALNNAAQNLNRDTGIFVCVDSGEGYRHELQKEIDTINDIHAGEIDTSLSLELRPDLVQMHRARRSMPQLTSRYLEFSSQSSVPWYSRTKQFTHNGVFGDPTLASAEKGERLWNIMLTHTIALLEDLKAMSLEEIHQRSY